ncbi:MAG TPA: hypothetical protein VMR96_05100 [Solirubrobacterales bacterium]|nr:hypothetical protein [Solirubrobacterales bacterium]
MTSRALKSCAAIAVTGVLVLVLSALAAAAPVETLTPKETSEALAKQGKKLRQQGHELNDVADEVDEVHTITTVVLAPIAVLVGILALGGSLGIVFSFRDQRRVSQLHELTMGSETMSQRRTEQSYASFFEQSQTTLALVNDTLKLAKEATDQAAHSMQQKAEVQVDAIEERAEDLMQRAFKEADFEILVYEPGYRSELHAIGDELRSLEGYLTLQNIQLPRHTKFVKALDQFLLDDTEGALNALRRASQSDTGGPLHQFTLFWLGYMYTTVGDYEVAVRTFLDDEVGLKEDDTERFQLECIIAETRFFEAAKKRRAREAPTGEEGKHEPQERFQVVAPMLDRLTDLALAVATSEDQRDLHHVALEIARTRADIYVWIAYDPERIDDPLPSVAISEARNVPMLPDPAADIAASEEPHSFAGLATKDETGKAVEGDAMKFTRSSAAGTLSPDGFRAWALMQARAICESLPDPNFDVAFALAECHYMLVDEVADKAFADAERALGNEFGDYLEKRKKVSLRQSELICHSRLLALRRDDEQEKEYETRRVRQSERQAREAVSEMRQARVTVFSQIQRRNITQPEYIEEVERIVDQDHLDD